MWEPRVLPLKGGTNIQGPSNSCDVVLELCIELDQFEGEAKPYFLHHHSGVIYFLSIFCKFEEHTSITIVSSS